MTPGGPQPVWPVLVVDDDDSVLDLTRLVLERWRVDGRGLRLVTASSASEARLRLEDEVFALAIVDVVMETELAGLQLVRDLRADPRHKLTQVVVRTGEPGAYPEAQVIQEFQVSDYWPKADLRAARMRASVTGLVRSYATAVRLEAELADRVRLLTEREALLREREALLREVHHRVNNNLQLIRSLLAAETDGLDAPGRAALQRMAWRVQAMAVVHNQSYAHPHLAMIDLAAYFAALVPAVSLDASVGPLPATLQPIPLDLAVTAGLLVTELFALVDAAGHGSSVEAAIEETAERLVLRFTIVGPAAEAVATVGRRDEIPDLIRALLHQLRATVGVEPGPPAVLRVQLPKPAAR